MKEVSIFWFRRDLRLFDNAGLAAALQGDSPVLPLFIFDRHILDDLEDREDARVEFIHQEVHRLREEIREAGGELIVRYGFPEQIWEALFEEYPIRAVFTNRDYEPYAKERDELVRSLCEDRGVAFHDYKDQVIFDRDEVVKDDGDPYVVFTPYSKKWLQKLDEATASDEKGATISKHLAGHPSENLLSNFAQHDQTDMPGLEAMDFLPADVSIPDRQVSRGLIRNYDQTRNFPAQEGTSRLGIHFRFGTISIREKARKARSLNKTFLNELIWRDFYSMILDHFPKVVNAPFREKYDFIPWRNVESEFKKWCAGKTGYPIVDAGMRQLNQTGYMHNRVRMITASFLTKHLLIDWRWGEAYFASKLLDYDLASNNGGWQWAAGTGTDAAPYFRIFNPTSQQEKFDKDKTYIREWVPEFGTDRYPEPMVDHKFARERCLDAYRQGLDRAENA